MGIDNLFKVVDVQEENRHGCVAERGRCNKLLEGSVEVAAVEQSGQAVMHRLFPEFPFVSPECLFSLLALGDIDHRYDNSGEGVFGVGEDQ